MAFFKGSAYMFTPLFDVAENEQKPFRGLRGRKLRQPIPLLEPVTIATRPFWFGIFSTSQFTLVIICS